MFHRSSSNVLLGSLLAAALLAAPTSVEAQMSDELSDTDQGSLFVGVMGLGLASMPITVFGIADIVYGSQERLLPMGWAIPQLLSGVALTVLGVSLIYAFWDWDWAGGDSGYLIGGVPAAIGSWFVAHAIWSLVVGDAPPDQDLAFSPLVQPQPGGGVFGLAGTF